MRTMVGLALTLRIHLALTLSGFPVPPHKIHESKENKIHESKRNIMNLKA